MPTMSLNGLDDVAVTQAYQNALAEAGGWCEPPGLRNFEPPC